ncbi:MAG: fibronectin type III domain-containing protein, partial [Armatimonadetes bacterium]|nr:fibronectin type III domain-containing protein [Armatimonadota bacterium]
MMTGGLRQTGLVSTCAAAGLYLLAVGAFAQGPAPQSFPAPTQVRAQDDEADKSGTRLQVEWAMPTGAERVDEFVLEGYRIYAAEAGEELVPVEVVEDAETTEAVVRDLWPGKEYEIQLSAVYLPEGQTWATDDEEPTKVITAGAVEALSPPVGPYQPTAAWYDVAKTNVLVATVLYCAIVLLAIYFARRGEMYIRPIPGLEAVNDAIGRATEMGRPILYISGLSGISDIATIASMLILGHLSKRTAAYETPIIVPCNDPLVMTAEREIVQQAYLEAGKPDAYKPENIFYVTDSQFGYAAAVDGIMMREKPAANFFMGMFFA